MKRVRRGNVAARGGLLLALLLPAAARAEEEPTPFWMTAPPPAKKEAPAKKPVKKKPVQIEPLRIRRREGPPVVDKRRPPPPPDERSVEPTSIDPAPRPKPPAFAVEPAAPPAAMVAPAEQAPELPTAAVLAEPDPEPRPDERRRWSLGAAFGSWGKSRSDGGGRDWQVAYGLRIGRALWPALELEVELLRAGGSAGSPFVSASATHNLAALRAFWVLGDRLALLLGGGAGAALAQTHYTLQPSTDPGVVAAGLDATAVKSVIEITASGRARIFRGLEVRGEVSAAMRDGKLELLPLLGAGAAF